MPETSVVDFGWQLRNSNDPLVNHRRGIVGLSVFSCAVLGGIALFQVGLVKRLPDPPISQFDANAVNGSIEAYRLLQTPDALLGMASYAATACLAGMGPEDRWHTAKWIPLTLGAKAALDAAMAARLSLKQATKLHKYSVWSLLVAGATVVTLSLALPEAWRAVRRR